MKEPIDEECWKICDSSDEWKYHLLDHIGSSGSPGLIKQLLKHHHYE
jgi:hypothetical protein